MTLADKVAAIIAELGLPPSGNFTVDVARALERLQVDSTGKQVTSLVDVCPF